MRIHSFIVTGGLSLSHAGLKLGTHPQEIHNDACNIGDDAEDKSRCLCISKQKCYYYLLSSSVSFLNTMWPDEFSQLRLFGWANRYTSDLSSFMFLLNMCLLPPVVHMSVNSKGIVEAFLHSCLYLCSCGLRHQSWCKYCSNTVCV